MTDIEEKVRDLRIEDYNYDLPEERIARHPLARREQCLLLRYHDGGQLDTHRFAEVPTLLPPDTLLVYNNTRVINARLRFRRATGALIEIFCLEPVEPVDYELIFKQTVRCTWLCLVGNGKRWKEGPLRQVIDVDGHNVTLNATRGQRRGNAFEITFDWHDDNGDPIGVTFATLLEAVGEIPIPPYLNRATEQSDLTDYQTVYSHIDGSVAAPTAGLHFTDELLRQLDRQGIRRRELTLHVGAGTFQPVKSEHIGDHEMHHEFIAVKRDLLVDLRDALLARQPVIAVGTTSVRTLESLYYIGKILHTTPHATPDMLTVTQWMPYRGDDTLNTVDALNEIIHYLDRTGTDTYMGSTQLLIAPGFRYRIVNGMITNFHQPQSTLLLLVAAFIGDDRWKALYDYALAGDYRFLSYGDACLLLP